MTVHQEDVDFAKKIKLLWEEETPMVTATERRIGPGGSLITPTTVIATDKRVIIINRTTMGIRNDYESIPYNRITSVRLEHGVISSSVYLRIEGYTSPGEEGFMKPGEQEGEIPGLRGGDAKALYDFINKMLTGMSASDIGMPKGNPKPTQGGGQAGGYVYCSKCGAKNSVGSKFCSACGNQLAK